MSFFSILSISFGLAMDAFAVSVSGGAAVSRDKIKKLMLLALSFGVFQGLMPLLGWWCAGSFRVHIESYDHWIAFGLLAIIGGKMVYESFGDSDDNSDFKLNLWSIIVLSVATSIDAFAAGAGLSCVGAGIFVPVIVIGLVTFLLSSAGVLIGKRTGRLLEKKAVLIGGIVLIGIGIKILIEHKALF